MTTALRSLLFLLMLGAAMAAQASPELQTKLLRQEWSYDPTGVLRGTVTNPTNGLLELTLEGGMICELPDKARVVTLREAVVVVPSGATVDTEIPAAVVKRSAAVAAGSCTPLPERLEKLAPLLAYLKTRADVPRGTSQLAVLCVTEDITFAGWEKFLQTQRQAATKVELTPAEIVQAVDALGILREIAPRQTFALASDGALKLRALRNPWCRAKAMHLYGLTVPELGSAQAPDLGELLHTKANDNCPVCRLRGGPPGSAGSL